MTTCGLPHAVAIALMAWGGGCTPEATQQLPAPQVAPTAPLSGEALASEVALYSLLTDELTQLGWPFACVGVAGRAGLNQIDPPHKVATAVSAHNPAFGRSLSVTNKTRTALWSTAPDRRVACSCMSGAQPSRSGGRSFAQHGTAPSVTAP